MKIASVRLHRAAVARRYGTVIAQAGGTGRKKVELSHFIFVEATTDDGLTAWGEISDYDPADVPNLEEYADLLTALMRGRNPFQVQQLHHDLRQHFMMSADRSIGRYTACALDMLCYDLQGQATGQSVCDLLGGAMRREVTVSWVAYIRPELELLREEVREKVSQGFTAFKLKVGVDIDLDEQRVALVREVAGPRASIKVDANEGWNVETAPKNIRRLARYHLHGVETPVPRDNPAEIAAVRKQVDVPILEHVNDPDYALALIKAEAVDVFNISTPGCGGLWPARQVAAIAAGAKVGVLLGSTVELGLGTLAQLHLAATVADLTLPSDLIGPGMYVADVLTEPLTYRHGKLAIPSGAGLGGKMSAEKLAALHP